MKLLFQLFIFLLPTQLAYHFWPNFAFIRGVRVDYLAPAVYLSELVLFTLLVLWIYKDRRILFEILRHWRVLVLLLAVAGINILNSPLVFLSFYKWIRVVELLALYFFIKRQKQVLHLIKLPVTISLILTLFLALTQMIKSASVGGIFYWLGERSFSSNSPDIALVNVFGREFLRPYATFPHPNALAGFALVLLFMFWRGKGLAHKIIVTVSLALVFLSFSQNAWLALFAAPLLVIIIKKVKLGFWKFLTSAAVASFFLTILPIQGPKEIFERGELNTAAGRLVSLSPVYGVGLGVFVSMLPELLWSKTIWLLQPVHNIFLLLSSEVGILGLVLFVYFIGKNMNAKNLLPVIALVLTGFFDHYWVSFVQNYLLMAIVLGLDERKI